MQSTESRRIFAVQKQTKIFKQKKSITMTIQINKQDVKKTYPILEGEETKLYSICQSTGVSYNHSTGGAWCDDHLKLFVEPSYQPPACRLHISCKGYSKVQEEAQRKFDLTLREFLTLVYDIKVKEGEFQAADGFPFSKTREEYISRCF